MRILLSIIILINFLTADDFTHRAKYKLKKDQAAWILIKKKTENKWHRFDFSWTLYSDRLNIILHTKYHNFVKQLVLATARKRGLFKQKLILTPHSPYDDDLSVFLEFVDFKAKNNIQTQTAQEKDSLNTQIKPPYAVFNALIKDKNQILDIEFHPKKAVFFE